MSDTKEITLDDVYKALMNINQNLTKKIEDVEVELRNIRRNISVEVKEIKGKVAELESENEQLKNRIKQIERKSRNKNIIIYGLKEVENEPENLVNIIEDLLINKLRIQNFSKQELANVFRLGKKVDRKNRPILIELLTQFVKSDILSKRANLKGSGIYINEDLAPEDREERKIVYKAFKEAKLMNKSAIIKGRDLILEGTKFTPKDIIANKHLAYCPRLDYHSPPPARGAYSDPSTPTVSNTLEAEETGISQTTLQSKEKEDDEDKKRKLDETPGKPISQRKKTALYHLRSASGTRQ